MHIFWSYVQKWNKKKASIVLWMLQVNNPTKTFNTPRRLYFNLYLRALKQWNLLAQNSFLVLHSQPSHNFQIPFGICSKRTQNLCYWVFQLRTEDCVVVLNNEFSLFYQNRTSQIAECENLEIVLPQIIPFVLLLVWMCSHSCSVQAHSTGFPGSITLHLIIHRIHF